MQCVSNSQEPGPCIYWATIFRVVWSRTVARMGTLSVEGLESLLRGQDCIVLFCAGKIMCGCSKQFSSLAALADHVARAHAKLPASPHQHQEEGVQEYFRCVRVAEGHISMLL